MSVLYNFLMKKYFKHKLTNLINVSKIVTIHDFEFKKNYVSQGESHDFWELVYLEKGKLLCTADGKKIKMDAGDILFHKPNEFHTLATDDNSAPNVFILSFECRSDAMRFFENKKFALDKNLSTFLYLILKEGKNTFNIPFSDPNTKKMQLLSLPTLGGEQLIKNYLEIFLINLLRLQTETETGNETFLFSNTFARKPVKEVIKVLKEHLYKPLTIEEICEKTAYGKAYLFRVFKAGTGKTMMEYFMDIKLERAKQLLRENELSVKEISDLLAFSEPNYFTKIFKSKVGFTPSAYKRRTIEL